MALTKCFNDVTALRGANFVLERGQAHGLAGTKGAGKSTLIKILAGVHWRSNHPDRTPGTPRPGAKLSFVA